MEDRVNEKLLNKRFMQINKDIIGVVTAPLILATIVGIAVKNKASAIYSGTALIGVGLGLVGMFVARHNKYEKCKELLNTGMKVEFLSAVERVNKNRNSKVIIATGAIGEKVYEFESEAYPLDAKLKLLDTEIYVDTDNINNFYVYIPEQ